MTKLRQSLAVLTSLVQQIVNRATILHFSLNTIERQES